MYKKILKAHPDAQMTYTDLLDSINESNLNAEGCTGKKMNKKALLNVIEIEIEIE